MADPLRITVSGYYGFNNTGDEAVLAGMLESFRARAGDGRVRITPLSADRADTRARHGLSAVDRMDIKAVRRAIADSDLFLSGGGSLLQDTTSLRSVLYYLWVTRMALSARKPVMFYAQGIGPLRRTISRALTRIVASRVQQITVRDSDSARLLREIGVTRPPTEVTADPAFALSPASEDRATEILADCGLPAKGPLIGLAPRPWHYPRPTVGEYAEIARALSAESGSRVLLLPMQPPGDLALCEQISAEIPDIAHVARIPISPQEMVALMSRLSLLIAMRLHALIFAAVTATPMIALGYDPKVRSLMEVLGQPGRCIELESFDCRSAVDTGVAALHNADSARSDLRFRAESLRRLAHRNADLALSLASYDHV